MNRPYPRLLGGRFAEWTEGAVILPRGALPAATREVLDAPMPREDRSSVTPPWAPPSALELEGTFAPLALGEEVPAAEDGLRADDRAGGPIENERARISRRIALTAIALLGSVSVAIALRISLTHAASNSDSDTALLRARAPFEAKEESAALPVPKAAPAPRIEVGTTTATGGSVSIDVAPSGGGSAPDPKAALEKATSTAPREAKAPDAGSPPSTTVHLVPIKSTFEVQN